MLKKKSNQRKNAQGAPGGVPSLLAPRSLLSNLFPRSVLTPPIPPHPGARRNKKIASPYPIPTPKTPRAGRKGGRIAPSQGDARTHLSFSAPPREVHP